MSGPSIAPHTATIILVYSLTCPELASIRENAKEGWQMGLSTEQKASLKARYDVWGLDLVRMEIERNDQKGLTPPDVIDFARAWIVVEEAKSQRTIQLVKIVTAAVFALLGGTIAGFLVF